MYVEVEKQFMVLDWSEEVRGFHVQKKGNLHIVSKNDEFCESYNLYCKYSGVNVFKMFA